MRRRKIEAIMTCCESMIVNGQVNLPIASIPIVCHLRSQSWALCASMHGGNRVGGPLNNGSWKLVIFGILWLVTLTSLLCNGRLVKMTQCITTF
jgi:hypothetical protein